MSKYITSASRVTLPIALMFAVLFGLIANQESDTARAVTRYASTSSEPVAAVSALSSASRMSKALDYARTQKGDPYSYGASGPNAWDCSGLAQWAYRKAGVSLPRTTYDMLKSSKLRTVSRSYAFSHRGVLAFHGSGHVELVSSSRYMFGAHHTGTRVGFRSWYDVGGWTFKALR